MQNSNWIIRGEPATKSRFWNLLQGARAEMFGVFSPYELQVIHDWIRGDSSSDGRPYSEDNHQAHMQASLSFRASSRLDAARGATPFQSAGQQLLDPDLQILIEQLLELDSDGQEAVLIKAMSPAHHWTPAGLYATRLFDALIS